MLRVVANKILPPAAVMFMKRMQRQLQRRRIAFLPPLTEEDFRTLLKERLRLREGDTVFVHSSMDMLNPAFPAARVLAILLEVVGESGTLAFPTYPRESSSDFLRRGLVFNVRTTPAYTGLLTELARRHPNAIRSLHPTKSVCAIGRFARELTERHQHCTFPYDRGSPYHKLMKFGGKVVGLGISTNILSFVHCIDDALKEDFPVRPYHTELFEAHCVNDTGSVEVVRTYAHDLEKMSCDFRAYVLKHLSEAECYEFKFKGRLFYRADTRRLFSAMIDLARRGITIYPRAVYEPRSKAA